MSRERQSLANLQHTLLQAICSPQMAHGVLPEIVKSRSQSAAAQLAIYQHAYVGRLIACLQEQFPVLLATMDEDTFRSFTAGYLERYPPTSYTLDRLADRFVDYLRETRPAEPAPSWPDFLIELAQLEWTIGQVFDGAGMEELPPLRLDLALQNDVASLRFIAAPCLRLLSFSFPVNDYYTAARSGENASWPDAAASFLAITRHDFVVRRVPLEEMEYRLLQSLVSGLSLGEALGVVEPNASQVKAWFEAWGRLRFFVEVVE
jgi:hypothetical protein